MDKQTLQKLIEESQKGNRKAMEKLLTFAYTPISFQCHRLLNDLQAAESMTEKILKTLSVQIVKIESTDHFHKWIGNVTATRCMRMREKMDIKEFTSDSQYIDFPSNELSKAETAQVVLILADSLPEDLRICLILSACCRVSTKGIAQMTGIEEGAVAENLAEAERGILEQMQIYQSQGVVFAGSLAVAALLRTAMYGKQNRETAAAMVRKVLPPVVPASATVAPVPKPVKPQKKPNNTIKILLCVAVALVLLVVVLICGALMSNKPQDPEETTLPSTVATTAVTETTEATTEATTEETTEPTTEPTTEATTVPETTEALETTEATEVPETTAPKNSSKPVTNTGSTTTNNTPKPTTDPNYNPGQGEDGHTHDFFTVPAGQNATCTRAAKIHRLCRICQHGVTVDDPDNPPLGHDYQVNIVVQPTTTSKGYTIYKCTRCSDSYDADYVDPLPAPETQAPVVETQAPVVDPQEPASDPASISPDAEPVA